MRCLFEKEQKWLVPQQDFISFLFETLDQNYKIDNIYQIFITDNRNPTSIRIRITNGIRYELITKTLINTDTNFVIVKEIDSITAENILSKASVKKHILKTRTTITYQGIVFVIDDFISPVLKDEQENYQVIVECETNIQSLPLWMKNARCVTNNAKYFNQYLALEKTDGKERDYS